MGSRPRPRGRGPESAPTQGLRRAASRAISPSDDETTVFADCGVVYADARMGDERPIVLLVEDDPSIAQLYSIKLRMDGYRVDIANDAATAAIAFDRARPDVVCVDSRLPDGSGRDVMGAMVGSGATVMLLTNDQEAYDRPPAG